MYIFILYGIVSYCIALDIAYMRMGHNGFIHSESIPITTLSKYLIILIDYCIGDILQISVYCHEVIKQIDN